MHPSRRPLVAGNWKMHKTPGEATAFLESFAEPPSDVEVWLFPAFVALPAVVAATEGRPISVGAQNVHEAEAGAYTGEVSTGMLEAVGVAGVLVGHSERRHLFGEDDARIAAKVARVLDHSRLRLFLCVGETLAEREAGQAEARVEAQLAAAFGGREVLDPERVVVAYEPVWAIGTGRTATPTDAQAMHALIRAWLERHAAAGAVRILYGGSVKPDNAAALTAQPDVDGVLVGGASLDPESFGRIVAAAT